MFKLAVDLPYKGTVRIKELTNGELFNILKYCVADDSEGLEMYFDEVIFSTLPPLNVIDKFYLLLFLRSFYISDTIQIDIKHDKVNSMELYMENMLHKIETLKKVENKSIQKAGVVIELGPPSKLYYDSVENIVYDCIQSIKIGKENYDLTKMSLSDKDIIFDNLKCNISTPLYDYFEYISSLLTDVTLIDSYPQYDVESTTVKLLSNDPLKFIMIMFSQNISDFLSFMYHYVNKVGGTFKDFLNLTYNDSKIIFDYYQEEVMKQNESLNTEK